MSMLNIAVSGLNASQVALNVASNNIANVNTPNFKKSDVVFEELLAKEIGMDDSGRLPLVRTHDRHLPVGMIGGAKASIQEDDTTTMRVDNNNVDIDIEMASLAKNQLYYNAMATELGGYVNKLKNVITSGQS